MSLLKYSDDEPRDDQGRWTDGGGGDEGILEPPSAVKFGSVSQEFTDGINFSLGEIPSKLLAASGVSDFRVVADHKSAQDAHIGPSCQAFYSYLHNYASFIEKTMGDMSSSEQQTTIRHELMHAIDSHNSITTDQKTGMALGKALGSDMRGMTKSAKQYYAPFLTPDEAFAEIGADLTGDRKGGLTIVMPKTTEVVRSHLKRLGVL